jgi:hypothetical protein
MKKPKVVTTRSAFPRSAKSTLIFISRNAEEKEMIEDMEVLYKEYIVPELGYRRALLWAWLQVFMTFAVRYGWWIFKILSVFTGFWTWVKAFAR